MSKKHDASEESHRPSFAGNGNEGGCLKPADVHYWRSRCVALERQVAELKAAAKDAVLVSKKYEELHSAVQVLQERTLRLAMNTKENIYDEVEQEDTSGANFSASEDEWTPEKTKEPAKKPAETKKAKGKPSATAKKPVIPTGPIRVSRRIAAKKGVELPDDMN
ncbi:uncharacterized protein LOC126570903 [Anopheles aquasalis]|uniref:uncharacterized protein LOC126570903 n=1 Tax=Anopheles aquasalis TaxID=42839 RepID=UPI00215B136D|nr:uncharacterized protein LOC126570903 [Anopheles aquasalis]